MTCSVLILCIISVKFFFFLFILYFVFIVFLFFIIFHSLHFTPSIHFQLQMKREKFFESESQQSQQSPMDPPPNPPPHNNHINSSLSNVQVRNIILFSFHPILFNKQHHNFGLKYMHIGIGHALYLYITN